MKFGLDKCNKLSIVKGRLTKRNIDITVGNEAIKEPNNGKAYKYLGVEENNEINRAKIKFDVKNEYFSRIKGNIKNRVK